MASHYELVPDPNLLPLSIAQEALRAARTLQTANAGSLWIPNEDGTGTLIGEQAGSDDTGRPNGVVQFVGDLTPPSKPTGISASCRNGVLVAAWDGTLAEGVPADFSHVEVVLKLGDDPVRHLGRLKAAGTLASGILETGDWLVWATAVDVQGNESVASDRVSVHVDDPMEDAQQQLDDVSKKADQAIADAEQVRKDAEAGVQDAKDAATEAARKADEAAAKADSVSGDAAKGVQEAKDAAKAAADKAEQVRKDAATGVQSAKDAAAKAQSSADNAIAKSDKLSESLDATNTLVEQHTTKLGELVTKVSNAQSTADSALGVATQVTQDAKQIKTTADKAYSDAQSALTQSSTAIQKADQISTTLETNYYSKTDADKSFASKSELKQTSDSITSTVEKTYATKSALSALQNIADNAIETWTGTKPPSTSNAPASTWTSDALKKQHAGDIYYDTTSGMSYRWGSTDGKTYTWTLIKDTDIAKAIADAAKAQSSADSAQKNVDGLKTSIPATYATKSELKQTSDSITSKVTETATVAQNALSKATTVEQTANGLKTTVSEQATTIAGQSKTISQLSQKADSLSSTITQVSEKTDLALANTVNLVQNPGFETGDLTGWTTRGSWAVNNGVVRSGKYRAIGTLAAGTTSVIASSPVPVTPGRTYEATVWVYCESEYTVGLSLSSKPLDYVDGQTKQYPANTGFTRSMFRMTVPDGVTGVCVRVASNAGANWLRVDDVSLMDVTDAANAQTTADSAITRTSTLEQSLNGFKTTVSQTYLSKSDASKTYATQSSLTQTKNTITAQVTEVGKTANSALAKATTVEQTANGLKTTVSEQAATIKGQASSISQLEQTAKSLSSTITQTNKLLDSTLSNMIVNPGFETGDMTGWAAGQWSKTEVNTANPHSGSYKLLLSGPSTGQGWVNSRDFAVIEGHTYEVSCWVWADDTALVALGLQSNTAKWSGTKTPVPAKAGVWAYLSVQVKATGSYTDCHVYIGKTLASGKSLRVDDVSVTDVTAAQTAKDTADEAVTRTSKLEQSLDGFKTTVSQTYETKSDASKKQTTLQQNLDGFKSTVSSTYLSKSDASKTYATQSSLTQTSNSLSSRITENATAAKNAMSKATSVEQTVNGLKTTVSEQASTVKGHTATLSQLQQTADRLSSTLVQSNQPLANPGFETGDMTGWQSQGKWEVNNNGTLHSGKYRAIGYLASYEGVSVLASQPFTVTPGRAYEAVAWVCCESAFTIGFSLADTPFAYKWTTQYQGNTANGYVLQRVSHRLTVPDGTTQLCVRLAAAKASNSYLRVDDVAVTDVTDTAKAQSTADAAVTRIAKAEQSLEGFKTTVSQTYETKSDALAKKTSLEQSLNGFKTTVSQTYLSKSDASKTYTTKTELAQTEQSITSTVTKRLDVISGGLSELVIDGGFRQALAEWTHSAVTINTGNNNCVQWNKTASAAGTTSGFFFLYQTGVSARMPSSSRARVLRLQFDAANWIARSGAHFGTSLKDSEGSWYDWRDQVDMTTTFSWKHYSRDVTLPANRRVEQVIFLLGAGTTADMTWNFAVDNVSLTDVTDLSDVRSELSTSIEQTAQDLTFSITSVSDRQDDTDDRLEGVSGNVDNLSDSLASEIATRKSYMRLSQDADGDPVLELGASANTNKVQLTNDRLSFLSGDSEVAYVGNDRMYINNATVNDTLRIGNFAFIPRSNGHLSLVRV